MSHTPLAKANDQAVYGSVNDALRLGCAAIGFTNYPGSDYAFETTASRSPRNGDD